jgi:hypothetical protein
MALDLELAKDAAQEVTIEAEPQSENGSLPDATAVAETVTGTMAADCSQKVPSELAGLVKAEHGIQE